eukprot:78281_1
MAPTEQDNEMMREAIKVMREAGCIKKTGGPFGCVIAKGGKIIAAGGNSVVADNDPSAHAEVNTIRKACKALGTWDLSGCVMYTSCQCCPMCYSTSFWARIDKIYYAAPWCDYDDIYSDTAINLDLRKELTDQKLQPECLLRDEAKVVWEEFRKMPDGARY